MGIKYLDALDDQTLDREQKSWAGGADEFATPTELPANIGGKLVNCIVEDNGRPRTRPGADPLGDAALDAGDRVQALLYFDTPSIEHLYASINQSLRKWDGSAWATVGSYPFGANNIVDMAQLKNLLYATSGTGVWYSYSGSAWSASLGNTSADPPNGATILCAHTFRIFATGAIAGLYDQIYVSALGDADAAQWNHTTWAFRVGRGEGQRIVGLLSGRASWLFVGKESSIFAVNALSTATSASEWLIARITGTLGLVGQRAWALAGDTIFVVSADMALREIIPSDKQDTPYEIGPAVSEPAKGYMDRINTAAQGKIGVHTYGRYLFVAVPLDNATEPSHVLVWNLRLRRPADAPGFTIPAFVGLWTGWTPTVWATTLFGAVGQRLVFGDADGYVQQWKDFEDQSDDDTFEDDGDAVLAIMRGHSWDFGTQRNPKDAESMEVAFKDSTATVDIIAAFDGEEQARWSKNLETVQNELPVDLPFDLAVPGPTRDTRNMDELPEFREMYLEIEQKTAGRVELMSMSAAAFVNTQENE